jgi:hypothetical protein
MSGVTAGCCRMALIVFVIEVKRLDADAIADEHELFFVGVPKRDAVVAFEVVNEVETAFFVEV